MSDREMIEETKKDVPDQMEPVIPEIPAEKSEKEPEVEAAEADITEPESKAAEADSTEPEAKAAEADSAESETEGQRSRSAGRRSGNRREKQQPVRPKKEHQASQRENILRLREIKKKKAAMPYMKILSLIHI